MGIKAIKRRSFLRRSGGSLLGLCGVAAAGLPAVGCAPGRQVARSPLPATGFTYPYELPELPYAYDALEPHIDAETMELHHSAHHQSYVDGLNDALEGRDELHDIDLVELLGDLESLPDDIREDVRNNGGGHLNHALFWEMMSPDGGGEPEGALADAIGLNFGGFESFREQFEEATTGRFGAGWAWLVSDRAGVLSVTDTLNQDAPAMQRQHAVLGIDVWEHAYYLSYRNRRAEYLEAWWNTVDWQFAAQRYDEGTGTMGPV